MDGDNDTDRFDVNKSDNIDNFDIETALVLVAEAVRPYPQAGLCALAEDGHSTLFEILVACILSVRTLDEQMLRAARRLFAMARDPATVMQLTPEEIDRLITPCAFHEAKARQIREIARRIVEEQGGELPCNRELLLSYAGVGPKCANLALSVACGQPYIGVDVHVHRVCNRWGYVQTRTPEQTLAALERKLPQQQWSDLNRLVMPFGKFICMARPRCPTCPLLPICPRIGVTMVGVTEKGSAR